MTYSYRHIIIELEIFSLSLAKAIILGKDQTGQRNSRELKSVQSTETLCKWIYLADKSSIATLIMDTIKYDI
jgi:hypothetical protein